MDNKDQYYKSEKEPEGGFKRFLWNPDTHEFCGRTGLSWLKITVFYIIFYAFLAAFWALMLVIFFQTIDLREPTCIKEGSRIGNSPGLGFRPKPPEANVDSTLIWFKHGGEGKQWEYWVNAMEEHLKPYKKNTGERSQQTGEHVIKCDRVGETEVPKDKYCHFDIEKVIPSNGTCTLGRQYGFKTGDPCILIKINRIYDWIPDGYDGKIFPADMPEEIKLKYNANYVYVTCAGENPADRENIGPITYYPGSNIQKYYYPFRNQPGYLSPFIFVHFEKPSSGVLINIECKAWAKNIKHDRMDRQGSVHFELLVD